MSVVRPDKQTFAVSCGQVPLNAKLNREEGMWPSAARERVSSVMFGKHKAVGLERVWLPVFIVTVDAIVSRFAAAAGRRTSIMEAIKCLKSIWWMPWR